jgi:hypothetical protein
MNKILYILDMLMDKVYNYIKHGLNMLYIYPNNLSKWTFSDRKSIFIYIRKCYETMDIT